MTSTGLRVWDVRNKRKHSRQAQATILHYGIETLCLEICSSGGRSWQDMENEGKGRLRMKRKSEVLLLTYLNVKYLV